MPLEFHLITQTGPHTLKPLLLTQNSSTHHTDGTNITMKMKRDQAFTLP